MTKDDIIRMAREAGAVFPADGRYHCFEIPGTLERFAALVAAHEREECAKEVDFILRPGGGTMGDTIRARGQA